MRDVVTHLDRWSAAGTPAVTATVVAVKRSAPRPPGAKMAVAGDGTVQGMVSGGCVEGAVVLAAEEVLGGAAPRLLHFGIADEEAWEVGLPCGGEIGVWVDRVEGAPMEGFRALAREGGRGALVTRLDDGAKLLVSVDGTRTGSLGSPDLDAAATRAAEELMWGERSAQRDLEGVPVFVDATAPAPRLLIIGAVDLARALCRLARVMGWEPYVADPRGRFATPDRFPEAEEVIAAWPAKAFARLGPIDRGTSIAILTHDPKIDDAALELALRSDAGYIGAMGSRRMQARRRERLLELGLTEDELGRMAAPIGLDLGALSVEETALAVIAEIVALRHGREGGRLKDAAGRIHEVEA
ncbi:MAG: XdhC family protein [Solirubrobacterales bacterium]|nr:XdhC family protein [Solirubrobacterales bacterium]